MTIKIHRRAHLREWRWRKRDGNKGIEEWWRNIEIKSRDGETKRDSKREQSWKTGRETQRRGKIKAEKSREWERLWKCTTSSLISLTSDLWEAWVGEPHQHADQSDWTTHGDSDGSSQLSKHGTQMCRILHAHTHTHTPIRSAVSRVSVN